MSDEHVFFQRPRKITTYGKKQALTRTYGYNDDSDIKIGENFSTSPTKAQRSKLSPAKSTRGSTPDDRDGVFDVPTSDNESSTTSSSKPDKPRTTPRSKPKSIVAGRNTPSMVNGTSKLDGSLSKKRKRDTSVKLKRRLSPSAEDIDQQVEAQFAREMGMKGSSVGRNHTNPHSEITHNIGRELAKTSESQRRNHVRRMGEKPKEVGKIDSSYSNDAIWSPEDEGQQKLDKSIMHLTKSHKRVQIERPPANTKNSVNTEKEVAESTSIPHKMKARPETPPLSDYLVNTCSTPKTQQIPDSIKKVNTTPRQNQLWSTLLNATENSNATPALADLHLTSHNRSHSPVKARLVDTLKAMSRKSDASFAGGLDKSSTASESDSDSDSVQDSAQRQRQDFQVQEIGTSEKQAVEPVPSYSMMNSSGPKITYGQNREIMEDLEPSSLEELLMQTSDFGAGPLSAPPATALESDSEDEGKAIKNVHELRASGDSRKFEHEIDDLVQEISDRSKSGTSLRRSALIGLCQQLENLQFKTRFLSGTYEHRVFVHCSTEADPIAGSAIAAAIILLLESGKEDTCAMNLNQAGVFETLSKMISIDRDIKYIAKDRSSNMSKYAQNAVLDLRDRISATIFRNLEIQVISPQLLVVKAVELLLPRLRSAGDMTKLLDAKVVEQLVSLLGTTARDGKGSSSLSILESFTISPSCTFDGWTSTILQKLVGALSQILTPSFESGLQDQMLSIRLCLNLINNSKTNANFFAQASYVRKITKKVTSGFECLSGKASTQSKAGALDALLLALGAVMTLAEMSDAARVVIAEDTGDTFTELVRIFLDSREVSSQADSIEQSHMNVAYGYLAVMLANICRDPSVCNKVKLALPDQRLDMVLDAVKEFILYHKAADQRDESNDVWVAFTNRLQSAADALESMRG